MIGKGLTGRGLLAYIVTGKFAEYTPLNMALYFQRRYYVNPTSGDV
jgi:transposase